MLKLVLNKFVGLKHLAQEAVVNMAMNLRFSYKAGNFLIS